MKKLLKVSLLLLCALCLMGCGKEKEVPTETTTLPPETTAAAIQPDMDFQFKEEKVTAKQETNLRDAPIQGDGSNVLFVLKNGEEALRIGINSQGWSKLLYQDKVCYAVSSLLTTDLHYQAPTEPEILDNDQGVSTEFTAVSDTVTAKDWVNLRSLPGVENPDAKIIGKLSHGDTAKRVGISGNGWSKLEWNGQTCYAVTSYLTTDMNYTPAPETEPGEDDGLKTHFVPDDSYMTAKIEVNLRTLPSITDKECKVAKKLKNGEVVRRTGYNDDVGWSRVECDGQVLYCVSSYLVPAKAPAETTENS